MLPGGQGTSVYADGLVLKPDADPVHTEWLAGVCARVRGPGFRLPAPAPALNGQLVVDGWAAFPSVEGAPAGDTERAAGVWLSIVHVSRALHHALRGEARPALLDGRTHKWAKADEIAWGSRPSVSHPDAEPLLGVLQRYMVDEGLENQLIHGDLSGNVLLGAGAAPAVIDFSPYWRPAAYGDAVVVVDALLWWDADPSLADVGRPQDLPVRRMDVLAGARHRLPGVGIGGPSGADPELRTRRSIAGR